MHRCFLRPLESALLRILWKNVQEFQKRQLIDQDYYFLETEVYFFSLDLTSSSPTRQIIAYGRYRKNQQFVGHLLPLPLFIQYNFLTPSPSC